MKPLENIDNNLIVITHGAIGNISPEPYQMRAVCGETLGGNFFSHYLACEEAKHSIVEEFFEKSQPLLEKFNSEADGLTLCKFAALYAAYLLNYQNNVHSSISIEQPNRILSITCPNPSKVINELLVNSIVAHLANESLGTDDTGKIKGISCTVGNQNYLLLVASSKRCLARFEVEALSAWITSGYDECVNLYEKLFQPIVKKKKLA